MTVTLTDPASGTSIELFQAQELTRDWEGRVDPSPPPGFDSNEPFLTSLEHGGTVTLGGAVQGTYLADDSGWSSDAITALAEWAVKFEAFVNGGQGDGYELALDYSSDTYTGYITTAQWTRRGGDPYTLQYNLDFQRGTGFGVTNSVSFPSVSATNTWTVDGTTIDTFDEIQVQKSQPAEVSRRSFATTPDDNDITSSGGATRTIRIAGQVGGTQTERNTFESNIRDTIGQDTIITIEDGFTGRSFNGMVESYNRAEQAGRPRLGNFVIELVEGRK